MTKVEKDRILLELYSLYNKSSYGEIQIDTIRNNILFIKNSEAEVEGKLMFLYNEGLVKFEYKPITGSHSEIIEIRIRGGIRFTEKGFDYLKELRKNKFVKFWELLYKFILPIGYLIDILWKIIAIFQKK